MVRRKEREFGEIVGRAFLAFSQNGDKGTLKRRLHIAKVNFKDIKLKKCLRG